VDKTGVSADLLKFKYESALNGYVDGLMSLFDSPLTSKQET
jgi:hypothetical protein